MVEKIDEDKDGFVNEEELRNQLRKISRRNRLKDIEARWQIIQTHTSVDEYLNLFYGALSACKNILHLFILAH